MTDVQVPTSVLARGTPVGYDPEISGTFRKFAHASEHAGLPDPRRMPRTRLNVMVSSTVHGGFRGPLKQIEVLLTRLGYEPWISDRGSLPQAPGRTALDVCLEAVGRCDVFLGIIRGQYGSGRVGPDPSFTHQEFKAAIQLDKVRYFAVEREIAIARQVLKPFRKYRDGPRTGQPRDPDDFKPNSVFDDVRVIEMYEEAMRVNVPTYDDRTDNWVQEYADPADLLAWVKQQFKQRAVIANEVQRRRGKP